MNKNIGDRDRDPPTIGSNEGTGSILTSSHPLFNPNSDDQDQNDEREENSFPSHPAGARFDPVTPYGRQPGFEGSGYGSGTFGNQGIGRDMPSIGGRGERRLGPELGMFGEAGMEFPDVPLGGRSGRAGQGIGPFGDTGAGFPEMGPLFRPSRGRGGRGSGRGRRGIGGEPDNDMFFPPQ